MNKENRIKRLNRLSVKAKEYRDENTQVVKLSQAIEVIELIDQLGEPEPQLSGKDKLRERVLDLYYEGADLNRIGHYNSALTKVIMLIDDLDEPEITEHEAWEIIMREHHYHISPSYVEEYKKAIQDGVIPSNLNKVKPVIPQFVAEYIESCKEKGMALVFALQFHNRNTEHEMYIRDWKDEEILNFTRAWQNGYEVEKETLFHMPLPYQSNSTIYYYKQDDGKISFKQGGMMKDHSKFTQEELDKYFPDIKHMAVEVKDES